MSVCVNLTRRSFASQYRNVPAIVIKIVFSICFSLIIGGIYSNIGGWDSVCMNECLCTCMYVYMYVCATDRLLAGEYHESLRLSLLHRHQPGWFLRIPPIHTAHSLHSYIAATCASSCRRSAMWPQCWTLSRVKSSLWTERETAEPTMPSPTSALK